jgi:Calcineurin-like phosphoesterase
MIRHMTQRVLAIAAVLLAAGLSLTATGRTAPTPAEQSVRIVAIGDIHGAFDAFVGILQSAGLIDGNRQWSGGSAVLVQTGDVFDRGAGVRDGLDLLMRLQDEAKRAGGRVEPLLGNHEMMNLISEYRDVSPTAYTAFADSRSPDRQRRAYDDFVKVLKRRAQQTTEVPSREEWNKSHPPGFVEYTEALAPRGKYGKWLRGNAVTATIGNTLFMHAGVNPASTSTIEDIGRTAAKEIAQWDDAKAAMVQAQLVPPFCTLQEAIDAAGIEYQRIAEAVKNSAPPGDHVTREFVDRLRFVLEIGKSSLLDPQGPMWFRGFAQWPDTEEPQVVALAQRLGVSRLVVAHTPQSPGRIRARFGNRVFLIDTGMLSSFYKDGRASALELQDGRVTAIYTDGRDVLVPSGGAHVWRDPLRDRLGRADAAAWSAASR